jgi:hypothetical protein
MPEREKGESVMLSSSLLRTSLSVLVISMFALGCNQGDERLEEKARIEGRAQAQAELQSQVDNLEKRVEIARAEGRAVAQAELQAQVDNLDLVVQRARAEGRAQAEAEINAGNANLSAKAQLMEADLATRHLFYQALKGTYEGGLATERGEFKVRITLVPSLPPATYVRSRQLEEITSDLNNLFFHAQVLQWNPANRLSSVGCRVENIRPDINKGEIAIASSNCPNLYKLRIADPEAERSVRTEENPTPKDPEVSNATATAIRDGKITELAEIRGEVHPTTNASIYTLSVKRSSTR